MTEAKLKETQHYAISQNVTILRNRVIELGVAEPIVQRQGSSRIVVQLPGVQDTARAKEILGATATLDRKSTRLNSSHVKISYAVFCLKKKTNNTLTTQTITSEPRHR